MSLSRLQMTHDSSWEDRAAGRRFLAQPSRAINATTLLRDRAAYSWMTDVSVFGGGFGNVLAAFR